METAQLNDPTQQPLPFDGDGLLQTAYEVLKGAAELGTATLLAGSEAAFQYETSDNWNGGTDIYSLTLYIPAEHFGTLSKEIRDKAQDLIGEVIREAFANASGYAVGSIRFAPRVTKKSDWRVAALEEIRDLYRKQVARQ